MSNQVEQPADRTRADRTRAEDDPYVRGWNEGKKFAEDRQHNLERLDAGLQEFLHCKIRRSTWRAANEVWQREQSSPNTYCAPEGILHWLTCAIPEMKFFMTWAEGQGHCKGFLEAKGIKAKTGVL